MNKTVNVVVCSMLAVLFCLVLKATDVKAWSYGDFDHINPTSSETIPAYTTWNDYQQSQGQNAQPSASVTQIYCAFGYYGGTDSDRVNQTIYFKQPINDYSNFVITPTEYNGVTYNLRYPVAFLNYYPTDVTIPAGYNTYSNSRSVIYPSSGKPIWSAFICGSTDSLLYLTNYSMAMSINPLDTTPYSFDYGSYYYDNYVPTANNPFFWHKPHRNLQVGLTDTSSMWCSYTDCPIFCDLYEALKYSETGVIDSTNEAYVLYGVDKAAVQPVTPTPTTTATPTPTTIPQITGTVSIDGGTVNIGNFPTPEPTPTPIVPIVTDGPTPSGGISSGNPIIDNSLLNDIIPSITPGGLIDDANHKISDALGTDDSLLPHKYLQDIINSNGSMFARLPLNAVDKISSVQGTDSQSYAGFFLSSIRAFTPNDDVAGGFDWDGIPFWILSLFVTGILVVIIRKVIH